MEGWIKIHRQIKEHWLWKSERRLKWWLDILLTVNHADTKILIRGTLMDCKRGQSVKSLKSWADRWGVSKDSARHFLGLLEKDQMITLENLKITTRLTVCNYDKYNDPAHGDQTETKRRPNGDQTEADPNNKEKEGKEGKEIVYIEKDFLPIFERWLKYKKDKRQSYKNEDSIKAAYNKLYKLAGGDFELADKIVEQSLANNWDGLFELKNKNKQLKKFTEDDF